MANVSVTQALQAAERLRLQFAALQFADLAITPTVSVGVAMASEAGRNLSALLALADRALIAPRPSAAIASRRHRSSGSRPKAAKPFAARLTARRR